MFLSTGVETAPRCFLLTTLFQIAPLICNLFLTESLSLFAFDFRKTNRFLYSTNDKAYRYIAANSMLLKALALLF